MFFSYFSLNIIDILRFHGCCQYEEGNNDIRMKFDEKMLRLENFGSVTVMKECNWRKILPRVQHIPTRFPRILFPMDSLQILLAGIKSGELYGFIFCDLDCDDDLIDELKDQNFAPIFNKVDLTDDHLSDYMRERYSNAGKKLHQRSLIQTFRAKDQLIHTCLAKYYLELGMKILNIRWFSQYLGEHAIKPFIDKVVNMRIEATGKDETKANTAKIIGNSGKN